MIHGSIQPYSFYHRYECDKWALPHYSNCRIGCREYCARREAQRLQYHNRSYEERVRRNFQANQSKLKLQRVRAEARFRCEAAGNIVEPIRTGPVYSLRIVLDASAKSSMGRSLNDVLSTGPKLHANICVLLARFRQSKYVFGADCEKMFLQIVVRQEDRPYQVILWKFPGGNLECWANTRVVFGMCSSPYIANRTLLQVAEDEEDEFPLAAELICNQTYIDDTLASFKTVHEAQEAIKQLIAALRKHGFELNKFFANHSDILSSVSENRKLVTLTKDLQYDSVKTLGFQFNFKDDKLLFKFDLADCERITKRTLLSSVMQIFNPTGLVEAVTVTMKLLLQDVWKAQCDWDDEISPQLKEKWIKIRQELPLLNELRIKRCVEFSDNSQIIIFADASERCYEATAYIKTGEQCHLLLSRSRLAPITSKSTIPRLELQGATIAVKLLLMIKEAYHLTSNEQICIYLDSQVALAQINFRDPEVNLKRFVSTRVKYIQSHVEPARFSYVKSENNPADLVSRGILPRDILHNELWWNGPEFLKHEEFQAFIQGDGQIPETRDGMRAILAKIKEEDDAIYQLIERKSSWNRLRRIVATMLRWRSKKRGAFDYEEIDKAEIVLIASYQRKHWSEDYKVLEKGGQIRKGILTSFSPFFENGVLRMKGRLQNSSLPKNAQQNILVPKYFRPDTKKYDEVGQVSKQLILHMHAQASHGGIQQTLALLHNKFKIINENSAAKFILRRCVKCQRINCLENQQKMGILPSFRVVPTHPFASVAVDYAGPINFRSSFTRGTKTKKSWIAIFQCNTTRAVHIELVTELTAASFLSSGASKILRSKK